jgi:hypothetical protein
MSEDSLRIQAVKALGGRCADCGTTDLSVLQINHIHGGGGKEAKQRRSVSTFYKNIIDGYRPDLNLLCANCNIRYEHRVGRRGALKEEKQSGILEDQIASRNKDLALKAQTIKRVSLENPLPIQLADKILEQREQAKLEELELIRIRTSRVERTNNEKMLDCFTGTVHRPPGFWRSIERMPEKQVVVEETYEATYERDPIFE